MRVAKLLVGLGLAGCAPSTAAPARRVEVPVDSPTPAPVARPAPPRRRGGPMVPATDFGRCVRSRLCVFEGLCSPRGADCIAAVDDDCRDSDACLGGRCAARGGVCVAGSDEACRSSLACTGFGRCYAESGVCVARSVDDCLASARCQRDGACRLEGAACLPP